MSKPSATTELPPALTLDELAARWRLSPSATRTVVQAQRVPFLYLARSGSVQVRWSQVRFRLDVLEAWEREQHREFGAVPQAEGVGAAKSEEWWE